MNRAQLLATLVLVMLIAPIGCENCRGEPGEPNVPDPSVGTVGEQVPTLEGNSKVGSAGGEGSGSDEEPALEQTPPFEDAFSAPDNAVTSEGRFAELMDQGLSDHMPPTGLIFASGGVDKPTVRVIVTPGGEVRWARGDGQYWDELDERGEVELGSDQKRKLADLIARAWTKRELTYPPSAAGAGELLVLRDGDVARVIEGSGLPKQLLPMRDLLLGIIPEPPTTAPR